MLHMPRAIRFAQSFLLDNRGNIALTAAIVLPVTIGGVGLAIDYGRLYTSHSELQQAIDSAALSASAAMAAGNKDASNVEDYTKKFIATQLQDALSDAQLSELASGLSVDVASSSDANGVDVYDVSISASFTASLTTLSLFANDAVAEVSASTAAQSRTESTTALSMFVVLDRSGSMSFVTDTVESYTQKCQNYTTDNWGYYPNLAKTKPCYVNKISALKSAADALFDELDSLENLEPSNKTVRVGAISFTDSKQSAQSLEWGTANASSYVNGLPDYPTGGTDMSDAMADAYSAVTASSETTAQSGAGNKDFYKFIVLMSDGENTGASSTWNSSLDTKTLSTCSSARSAGVTIYTVAFMAPTNGKTLLKNCVGVSDNYFEATDLNSLVEAFATIGKKVTDQTTRMTQ